MKIKHKSFPFKLELKDDAARSVEGWASTFGNKDSYDDIIVPGAFVNSIKARLPKMLYQHNSDQPIGVWTAASETQYGLYVKGELLDTMLGNDVYKMLKAGAISDMSIGYSTLDSDYDPKTNVRTLKEIDLWEVSLVTFPANDKANITMVKSVSDDIDAATDLLEQAIALCQAYTAGSMEPTPEAFGTVMQLMEQSLGILGDPDEDEEGGSEELCSELLPLLVLIHVFSFERV